MKVFVIHNYTSHFLVRQPIWCIITRSCCLKVKGLLTFSHSLGKSEWR